MVLVFPMVWMRAAVVLGAGGAAVVVGQCWVASCVVLMLARVSWVFRWVLGLLVLMTVSPLVPGFSAGEGVVAFGLGIGGGAGVGVAVTGPGFGRGWLGVAGCGRSPLLAEGLVGLPLCPSGVSGGPAAPLAGGWWVIVLWVFVCCVRLWCERCSRFGVLCAFVGLVSVAAVAMCVVCARGRVCSVLPVRLSACPHLSGLGSVALCGCGGCVS